MSSATGTICARISGGSMTISMRVLAARISSCSGECRRPIRSRIMSACLSVSSASAFPVSGVTPRKVVRSPPPGPRGGTGGRSRRKTLAPIASAERVAASMFCGWLVSPVRTTRFSPAFTLHRPSTSFQVSRRKSSLTLMLPP